MAIACSCRHSPLYRCPLLVRLAWEMVFLTLHRGIFILVIEPPIVPSGCQGLPRAMPGVFVAPVASPLPADACARRVGQRQESLLLRMWLVNVAERSTSPRRPTHLRHTCAQHEQACLPGWICQTGLARAAARAAASIETSTPYRRSANRLACCRALVITVSLTILKRRMVCQPQTHPRLHVLMLHVGSGSGLWTCIPPALQSVQMCSSPPVHNRTCHPALARRNNS
jgi:hypothetical protein